ncbi:MAG: LysR family transcriptional regulator, partial [Myxococcota bacterium]
MDELRIGQLRLLERTLTEGSISAAARVLGLTVPTASRQLRQLEETVGATLLNRTTRQLTLTREGELMLPHVL